MWEWGTPALVGPPVDHTGGGQLFGTIVAGNYPNFADGDLTGPVIAIPSTAIGPQLSFWMWMDAESGWDGGHLEISVDGGLFSVVPSSSLSPGYNGTSIGLDDDTASWNGLAFAAWTEVTMDLSASVGQTVQFRFHFGSDTTNFDPGWYIDDFTVSYVSTGLPPSAPTEGRTYFDEFSTRFKGSEAGFVIDKADTSVTERSEWSPLTCVTKTR